MENIIISILSILIGVGATIYASRHYYRRSVEKELTPFMQLQSNVLSHIDEEVKTDLHIEYKGVKVENLQQIQFLIANTGERAIRDIIRPMRLDLPKEVEIMEGSILHISPEGREVEFKILESRSAVEFDFPLLNKDDFFIFKLLVKGTPSKSDLKFSLVADDLPPKLDIQRLSYNQIESDQKLVKSEFELGMFLTGLGFLLSSFVVLFLAHYVQPEAIPEFQSKSYLWLNSVPIATIATIIGYIVGGLLFLLGILLASISLFENFEFPKKNRKFKVPSDLAMTSHGDYVFSDPVKIEIDTANKSSNTDGKKAAAGS
jgi:uncharacterized membrane protein YccF (DUF307 family)